MYKDLKLKYLEINTEVNAARRNANLSNVSQSQNDISAVWKVVKYGIGKTRNTMDRCSNTRSRKNFKNLCAKDIFRISSLLKHIFPYLLKHYVK